MGYRFAAALLGLLGCCLAATAQPSQPPGLPSGGLPPAPKVSDVRLYVLDCGTIISHEPERFGLTRQDVPDPDFSDPCFLVVHPKGMLFFVTALRAAQVGRPVYVKLMGDEGQRPNVRRKSQ